MLRATRAVVRKQWVLAAAAGLAILVSACGAVVAKPAARTSGSTVTFAQQPGNVPNYIFPITAANAFVSGNLEFFVPLMWRPLYWVGSGTKPVISSKLSIVGPPAFSNGGKTLTMTLKHYVWSDGQPVTSRDVEFFINLLKAGKNNWGGYSPGRMPDNISNFSIISSSKFSITFNAVYAPEWLENNELSAIIPLPQQSWDKTSLNGTVGNYDLTSAGATNVFNFLNQQSLTLSTYATNPLWQMVDGPFHMSAYSSSTNYTALEPNPHYTGAGKAKISKLEELPFTSETAEFDALRSGEVDYGYLPTSDVTQSHYFESRGYTVSSWPSWGINYMVINFSNPTLKPYFSQLYIRQALQDLVNQPLLIKDTLYGDGSPVDGPVPLVPKGPLVSPVEEHNPYPYSLSKAKKLLTDHGWKILVDGTDTCSRPGSASNECGAGIAKGASLDFPVVYPSGLTSIANGVQSWKSSASRIGLVLNIRELPLATIGEIAVPCTTGPTCTWGLVNWEGWGYQSPYPTGEETFSPTQTGGYNSATDNANITATHTSTKSTAMFQYEDYLAKNLPVIWWPNSPSQISVISKKLHGVQQNALGSFTPENWTLSS